jgi:hypothetical protein
MKLSWLSYRTWQGAVLQLAMIIPDTTTHRECAASMAYKAYEGPTNQTAQM